jgi:hypothetical protein
VDRVRLKRRHNERRKHLEERLQDEHGTEETARPRPQRVYRADRFSCKKPSDIAVLPTALAPLNASVIRTPLGHMHNTSTLSITEGSLPSTPSCRSDGMPHEAKNTSLSCFWDHSNYTETFHDGIRHQKTLYGACEPREFHNQAWHWSSDSC